MMRERLCVAVVWRVLASSVISCMVLFPGNSNGFLTPRAVPLVVITDANTQSWLSRYIQETKPDSNNQQRPRKIIITTTRASRRSPTRVTLSSDVFLYATSSTSSSTTTTPFSSGSSSSTNKELSATSDVNVGNQQRFQHAVAILAMPTTSTDRIANEVILETVLPRTDKLSVVLRCQGPTPPSLVSLRSYVGEVYSQLWDCVMHKLQKSAPAGIGDQQSPPTLLHQQELPDVVVYPSSLPNTAPESWIDIQPDLDCVCSHDSLIGWISVEASGRGRLYQSHDGKGGLDAHVNALNMERQQRRLKPVHSLHVEPWPTCLVLAQQTPQDDGAGTVVFVDDEIGGGVRVQQLSQQDLISPPNESFNDDDALGNSWNSRKQSVPNGSVLLGGAVFAQQQHLYNSVAVGGTWDGLHYGHRKLLTLAVSSLDPYGNGALMVGVTVDAMLQRKEYSEYLPTFEERSRGVYEFLARLAPGILNQIKIVPIEDSFGPAGSRADLEALVLSHETLETGYQLNRHRLANRLPPVILLCTRRTEAHGMSSTTLRKLRSQRIQRQQPQ